jgi:hypothetical protein
MDSIKPDSVTGDGWVERGCLLEGVISGWRWHGPALEI